jgi:hypothetical protein
MLASIGYDASAGTLEVEFRKGGAVWQYFDVPEHLWYEFDNAESHGKFFLANIKTFYRENRTG